MLQFAIAGLLTAAQIIVTERKSRTLQRLLTTATRRIHILLGHYLAIFILIFSELVMLILFGQILLKVDYLRLPAGYSPGGFQFRPLHRGPGPADWDSGKDRGTGHHFFTDPHVRIFRVGWSLGAAGGHQPGLPGHRASHLR